MQQSPILTFSSSAFPVAPGEDAETNPGIYGKSLAQWLSKQLSARGIAGGEAFAEDFGWCVGVRSGDKGVHVVCTSGETADTWQVFCFTERGFFEKLRGRGCPRSARHPRGGVNAFAIPFQPSSHR